METKTVCIVGAGAAGLASLKSILFSNAKPGNVHLFPVAFEKSDSLGGVWNFADGNERDLTAETAMYPGLITNLPKEIMRFMDFPPENYEGESDSFISRKAVLNYLQKYADAFLLINRIQLSRKVTSIKPIIQANGADPRWNVRIENVNDATDVKHYEFDYVMICNGHHNKRKYPENFAEIYADFQGDMVHSLDYKGAEPFKNKNVVVVGGGPSGIDVAITLSKIAKNVYLSIRDREALPLKNMESLQNFRQTPVVRLAKKKSVVLENSEEISCDSIVFCTGYEYEFPFLEPGMLDIKEGGKHVTPLYLHMIHMKYKSLCFIGLPYFALSFIMLECQSRFYAAYLQRDLSLPSESEMQDHFEKDQLQRKSYGLDKNKSHLMHILQWPYNEMLATQAGFDEELEPFHQYLPKVYLRVVQNCFSNPLSYRKLTFEDYVNSSESEEHELTQVVL